MSVSLHCASLVWGPHSLKNNQMVLASWWFVYVCCVKLLDQIHHANRAWKCVSSAWMDTESSKLIWRSAAAFTNCAGKAPLICNCLREASCKLLLAFLWVFPPAAALADTCLSPYPSTLTAGIAPVCLSSLLLPDRRNTQDPMSASTLNDSSPLLCADPSHVPGHSCPLTFTLLLSVSMSGSKVSIVLVLHVHGHSLAF